MFPEEWAVFKYLSTKYTPDDFVKVLTPEKYAIVDKACLTETEFKNPQSLLDISQDYSLISQDKYYSFLPVKTLKRFWHIKQLNRML